MDENEKLALQVSAIEDQVIAALHEKRGNIENLAHLSPDQWTHDDIQTARLMANGVLGMFLSGRL